MFSVQASSHCHTFLIGDVLHMHFQTAEKLQVSNTLLSLPCCISVVIVQEVLANAPEGTTTLLKARTTSENGNTFYGFPRKDSDFQ